MSLQWEPTERDGQGEGGLRLGDGRLSLPVALGIVLVDLALWACVWLAFAGWGGNH